MNLTKPGFFNCPTVHKERNLLAHAPKYENPPVIAGVGSGEIRDAPPVAIHARHPSAG
jgi:hypothetical protein